MIWLIGNKGMLGSAVELKLRTAGMKFSATDMNIDITSIKSLNNHADTIFNPEEKNWIINCSAYTAVDKAEDEPGIASKLNVEGVKNIAECAKTFNAVLIHISTDYVFDGKNPAPLTEDMKPAPVSVYGQTKLAGEAEIKNTIDNYFIIRTAWLYGLYGSNFVYTMLKLMEKHTSISVVNDQHGSPTNAEDLAGLIISIVSSNSENYGIYHYSNEGNITWYDFASKIYKLGKDSGIIKNTCVVNACGSDQYPTKAVRPVYSLLSKEKVKTVFNIKVPQWEDSLVRFISEIKKKGLNLL